MKSFKVFVEECKSLNQKEQEIKDSFKQKLPDDEALRSMTWNEMIRRLKLIYETEKREEIMKGLLSNPTHLELIRNFPLKGPTPKPSSTKKSSPVSKTITITKTDG